MSFSDVQSLVVSAARYSGATRSRGTLDVMVTGFIPQYADEN